MGEPEAGLAGDALLPGRPLDVHFHLVGRHRAQAHQRILEVRAHLAGSLPVPALILATKSLVYVTLTAHCALLAVLFGGRKWGLASPAAVSGVRADKASVTVAMTTAQLSLTKAVNEDASAELSSFGVDADGAGTTLFIGDASSPIARGDVHFLLLKLLESIKCTWVL